MRKEDARAPETGRHPPRSAERSCGGQETQQGGEVRQFRLSVFFTDTLERSDVRFLVHEPALVCVPLYPAVRMEVERLATVRDRAMPVVVASRWIRRQVLSFHFDS